MGSKVLVVPTIRAHCLENFMMAWLGRGGWDTVIIVEDNPRKTFNVTPRSGIQVLHVSHAEIDAMGGSRAKIFSRRDSAIRSLGFSMAVRLGADYVLTLDDDCLPSATCGSGNPIMDQHVETMANGHRTWVESVPGMRTRGLPYEETGTATRVMASMGLWTGTPDFDGVQSLMAKAGKSPYVPTFPNPRLIPHGQYFPMCGMNLCFHAKALPLFYFPLMGEGQPYSRFDDIWAGIMAKKVMDHLGWSFSVGGCEVHHSRASDPFTNLVKEAPGIRANETFWKVIDSVELTERTAVGCVIEMGRQLQQNSGAMAGAGSVPAEYVHRLGECLQIWAELFSE